MINYFATVWSAILGNQIPVVANFSRPEIGLTTDERGTYAAQALNNPAITEALDELEKEAMIAWENTLVSEVESREFIWSHVKALRQLRARLAGFIQNAKISERNRELRTGVAGNQARPVGNQD